MSEQSELITWLANCQCIYRGPDAVDTHIILVDREKLLRALDSFKQVQMRTLLPPISHQLTLSKQDNFETYQMNIAK